MNDLKLNAQSLAFVTSSLSKLSDSGDTYRISVKKWREKRSLSASAQYYVWLPVIAKFYGEDVEYIRKWMKWQLAYPILTRGGCDYAIKMQYMLDKAGYHQLNQKQQINMIDMFGITRFMNSKQHTELRDELQIFWAKHDLQLNYLSKDK